MKSEKGLSSTYVEDSPFKAMISEIGLKRLLKYFLFGLWDSVFRLLPYSPLRVLWLKIGGADVAWSSVVDRVNFINLDRTGLVGLKIGKKAFLGCATIIDLAGRVTVEDHATISPGAALLSHFSVGFSDHPLIRMYPKKVEFVAVKQGAFIGVHATILSGVAVGERAVVGAGAVVTKNVPNDTLAAGVPSKLIKKLRI